MKKLQNDFTTPEQSKRQLKLGVPADSANCYYDKYRILPLLLFNGDTMQDLLDANKPQDPNEYLPCWSSGRLMEIIDICEIDPKDEQYPTTKMIKDETKMDYIDYLVGTVKMMSPRLDFSKLED